MLAENHRYIKEISVTQQLSAYFYGSLFGMVRLAKDFVMTKKGINDMISIYQNNPYGPEAKWKKTGYNRQGMSSTCINLGRFGDYPKI